MIHDLKPYPAYKDSGVPWIGEVPEHWQASKVKNLARSGYKTFVDGDWIESPYITSEGIRLIQTGNIGVGTFREKGFRYVSKNTFTEFGCTEFKPNDVLICRLGEPVGRACLAPDLGVRMITSVDVCILMPREDALAAFVVYAMSSPQYLDWVNSLVRGSTRDRVSRSMLGCFLVPLPPVPEQSAIVRFLDHADRKIRHYIRGKQKMIKLLEEQKQAIIHRAVTRGLDPNVRLKPSGVEWLGDVPEHWEVWQIGHFATVGNGSTPSRSNLAYWSGGTYPWLNSSSVNAGTILTADQSVTDLALRECHLPRVPAGSVLVAITGQGKTRGTAAVLAIEATINQHIAFIIPRKREKTTTPEFLRAFLVAAYSELRRMSDDSGSTKAL